MEKNKYKISIDKVPYEYDEQFITGSKIKELSGADTTYGVWQKVSGNSPDIEIANDDKVDLSEPGREHFFTGPKELTEGNY